MKAKLEAEIKDIKTQWLKRVSGHDSLLDKDIEWGVTPIDIMLFQAGMRKVVEWTENNITFISDDDTYRWQAQLKEWELDNG